uniref:hypothetical protein n=1 Tax=Trichocoleus desertorum TaxID=1481672 RepID=UPI0025B48CB7|nr:hypothetical protein [Trichocoleus desertorum]
MFPTLIDFFQPIMSQIDKAIGNPTTADIEEIRQQLKASVLIDLSKLRKHYGELIKAYYRKNPPFGNREYSQDVEENFAKDLEDFIEIVSYSAEAGDPSILDECVVGYLNQNPKLLSKSLPAYVERFNRITTDWEGFMSKIEAQGQPRWPDETKPYWAYLVGKFSSKP